MDKIQTVSRMFRVLFQVLFCLTPAVTIIFWLGFPATSVALHYFPLPTWPNVFNQMTLILAFLVSLLPTVIVMYGLYQMIRLFKSYEQQEIFTVENVRRLKKFGYALFAWVIGGWIYDALLSLVFSMQAGQPAMIHIIFRSSDVTTIIVGSIIILISWVMNEAYKIAEEQAQTI